MKISPELALIISAGLFALGMLSIAVAIGKLAGSIASGMTALQRMMSGVLATASKIVLARTGKGE